MKKLAVIIIYMLIGGLFFVAGSLAGGIIAHRLGLFVGAFIGGLVGTYLAYQLTSKLRLSSQSSRTFIGAEVGTLLAFIIAATHLNSPLLCLLSPLCIGIGALIGDTARDNN